MQRCSSVDAEPNVRTVINASSADCFKGYELPEMAVYTVV